MAFDSDQTRKFIDLGDRDIAPFFAGRATEIRHFESSFNTLGWENKRAAAFRVFQGAPGCGKTSLVEHLRQRHADDALFVDIRKGHLVSEEALVKQIGQTALSVGSLVGQTIAAFAQAVGSYLGIVTPDGDEARNLVAEHMTRNKKVVLFMDEAQLVGEPQQPGLGLLHTSGLGFPTIALFAGLSHTSSRLRSVGGLSRLPDNAIMDMGAMKESECSESTARLLDAYGALGDEVEKARACMAAARLSRGWPQHLHGAQRALCRELLRTNGVLAGVDFDAVRAESDRARRDYYATRLSGPVLGLRPAFVATFVAKVGEKPPADPLDLIEMCDEELDRTGLADRLGTTGREFVDALFERGVLSATPEGRYDLAIPSMGKWLASLAMSHDTPTPPTPQAERRTDRPGPV